ncbi:MAG: hypothetical protein RIQ83_2376 [Pseudomonadota bacterium]|jgi:hypothetical protein
MEHLVWAIIGMAMLRHVPMTQLVNQLDILLPGDRPLVAPVPSCKLARSLATRASNACFTRPPRFDTKQANHPGWAVLQLLAVDGVMWRRPDTPENAAFAKPDTQHGETVYPQVHMLCQMELTSGLLVQAIMESCTVNEMVLTSMLDPMRFPGCRHRRVLQPSLGNRVGLSGDEAQPAAQPDGKDGGESVEFSHGIGLPHP